MFFPFLGFGVLLIILQAASTQSATRQFYPGIEEDGEIDRLAQLELAGITPEDLEAELNIPAYDEGHGPWYDEFQHDKDGVNLTPQQGKERRPLGYTANQPQFHLPREALVASSNSERNDISPPLQHLQPQPRMLGPAPPHMKKNSDQSLTSAEEHDSGGGEAAEGVEPVVQPSHAMTSTHAVDRSGATYATRLDQSYSTFYIVLVAAGSAMGVVILVGAGICWYRINERIKATADVDYPAYGVTGPSKDVSPTGGDRKLAQSAHMYHYQHQKQQMAALQKSPLAADGQGSAGSDLESDDENEEGDYTVYECPGLAPAGDMEVKNPLYQDEPTPATPQTAKCEDDGSTSEGGGGAK